MKKILFVFVFSLLISSCEEKPHDVVDYLQRYAFINNSGVKIAIVPKGYSSNLPDSLVLGKDEIVSWGIWSGLPISNDYLDPVKVYFNENVSVLYSGDFTENIHDPRSPNNYVKNVLLEDGLQSDVYTFTPEDYQRALEHNKTEK